jgi:hypothetical protein
MTRKPVVTITDNVGYDRRLSLAAFSLLIVGYL